MLGYPWPVLGETLARFGQTSPKLRPNVGTRSISSLGGCVQRGGTHLASKSEQHKVATAGELARANRSTKLKPNIAYSGDDAAPARCKAFMSLAAVVVESSSIQDDLCATRTNPIGRTCVRASAPRGANAHHPLLRSISATLGQLLRQLWDNLGVRRKLLHCEQLSGSSSFRPSSAPARPPPSQPLENKPSAWAPPASSTDRRRRESGTECTANSPCNEPSQSTYPSAPGGRTRAKVGRARPECSRSQPEAVAELGANLAKVDPFAVFQPTSVQS